MGWWVVDVTHQPHMNYLLFFFFKVQTSCWNFGFLGKFLDSPGEQWNDTFSSHIQVDFITNLMSVPHHECKRREYHSPCSGNT